VVEAGSLPDVLRHVGQAFDLILLDLQMPGMNGTRGVADARTAFPDAPIVVISGFTDPAVIRGAIANGANGYIPKTARGKSLVTALKLVMEGETYLPPSLLAEDAAAQPDAPLPTGENGTSSTPAGFEKLSPREAAVLRLLISGKTNKEIGRDLDLQEVTVKVHLRNVYRKIKATNRTDAVRIALMQGWQ
jgi:DNA-binding NarL/FixJ family response regulator